MRIKIIIFLSLVSVFSLSADSIKILELKKEKEKALHDIQFLDGEMKKTQKELGQSLENINILNEKLKIQKNLIKIISEEIKALDENIEKKEVEIKGLEKDFQTKKEKYAASVLNMYKNKDSQNQLLFILSADDFAQSLRRMMYLRKYSTWQKKQADDILLQKEIISMEKHILQANKLEKENISIQKRNEELQLQKEENEKKKEIANIQKNKKKLENDLEKKRKQAAELDKEIEKIILTEIEASKKEAKAKPGTRKAETQGGYAMTKDEQKLATDFASNKGKLPFPLHGKYAIVARCGQQHYLGNPGLTYTKNGIEIRTTEGNTARAVFDGIVTHIFHIPGSQLSICIRHGNYLTSYCYLENIFVKIGDKVKTGQEIGKIYNDSEKGTTLYFEIRKDKTTLNPEPWLNK